MKKALVALLLAGNFAPAARAVETKWTTSPAGVAHAEGLPPDLDKEMTARVAKLGKVVMGGAPLASYAADKTSLVAVAFSDIGAIERKKGGTSFVGHHVLGAGADFALVTFPRDVALTPRDFVVVVGTFQGTKEVVAVNGSKVLLPVIAARVVGVAEDGEWQNGRLAFTPDSDLRIYDAKAAVKKDAAKKP